MNERIREFAARVRYDARNEKHYLERVHNREFTVDEYQEIYDEKFAELIIKKCVMIGNYAHDGGEYPGPMIKEYFGVDN